MSLPPDANPGPQGETPLLPALPPLTNTYGAVLISSFVAIGLYGVTIQQTFQYYRSYPSDVMIQKLIVAALFIADTFHSVTLMHLCEQLLRSSQSPGRSIQLMSASTGVVVIIAQSFYTRRIYLVNPRYKVIVILIGSLILVELGFMIVATYHALSSRLFTDFAPYLWLDSVLFCLATVTDLILLLVFVVFLRSSRTSFRGTRVALDHLARYAVIATLLNSALTLPAFIASLTSQHTFIYIAMAIPTTKIYANSVLAFLNCRTSLVQTMHSAPTTSFSLSKLKRTGGARSQSAPHLQSQAQSHSQSRSPSGGQTTSPQEGETGVSSVVLNIKHAGLGVEEVDDGASVGGGEDSNSRDDFALAAKHPGLPVGE
ncbi:hypothetical protein C8Q76DRAFT_800776 [Earliella scabrosa]|nr:hypothetical protein C8Q76DRAFT_800776 [Earliella scabrosa]